MNDEYQFYQSKLQIDRNELDSDLIEQPQLVQDVGERFIEAMSRRDELYDEVKRVDASLDSKVRDELAQQLGKKPTEAMVMSAIELHDDHIEARQDYLDAKEETEMWRTLRDSFMERSKALRELGNLYVSGYFALDHVSDDSGNNAEVKAEGNKKRVAKAKRGQQSG